MGDLALFPDNAGHPAEFTGYIFVEADHLVKKVGNLAILRIARFELQTGGEFTVSEAHQSSDKIFTQVSAFLFSCVRQRQLPRGNLLQPGRLRYFLDRPHARKSLASPIVPARCDFPKDCGKFEVCEA